ncbi:MAG: metallophosphoesterase [Minisyncoccia bacterium]|jgi:diadenosine tetraphosphatase ApaH/serine/threonine PP2A family protein phosphatase
MTIVFGDAHGCYEQILALMDLIGPSADDLVISVGDFVDRGPDSPACVEFIKNHGSVMGNHEYKHVRFRQGILEALSPSQMQARAQFRSEEEYGAAVDFMAILPFYLDLPEATIVHAGLEYGIPMNEQDRIVLVGGMSKQHICGIDPQTGLPFWCARYPRDAKPMIFGHLSFGGDIPRNENLFPLDTGCCAGGKLTAVTLPDFRIYQVPGWQGREYRCFP